VSLLLCTAITYIQGTTYKIILYINNEERVHRSHNLPEKRRKKSERDGEYHENVTAGNMSSHEKKGKQEQGQRKNERKL